MGFAVTLAGMEFATALLFKRIANPPRRKPYTNVQHHPYSQNTIRLVTAYIVWASVYAIHPAAIHPATIHLNTLYTRRGVKCIVLYLSIGGPPSKRQIFIIVPTSSCCQAPIHLVSIKNHARVIFYIRCVLYLRDNTASPLPLAFYSASYPSSYPAFYLRYNNLQFI